MFWQPLRAQSDSAAYTGRRLAVLNIELKKTDEATGLGIRCDIANTGRLPLHFGKGKGEMPQNLVFEFDTIAMPIILRGREIRLQEAVAKAGINLAPGEIRRNTPLLIPIKAADLQTPAPQILNGNFCPDLVIDTIYLVKYTSKSMLLHYIIRNKGQAPAQLLGAQGHKNNLNLRVYFVSGAKLTRGAIEAGAVQIRKGVETLDGVLQPGQILQGEATVSLKLRTRFSPNLLLELDPFQSIAECDRTNNTRALVVEF